MKQNKFWPLKKGFLLPVFLTAIFQLLSFQNLLAQGEGANTGTSLNEILLIVLVGTLLIMFVGFYIFTEKLLKVTAEKVRTDKGIVKDEEEDDTSILPTLKELFPSDNDGKHPVAGDAPIIHTEKGMDVRVKGRSKKVVKNDFRSETFAINPKDVYGLRPIPKLHVKEGDEVKAGDPLFFDKPRPDINYPSPVSGEVVEIRRGDKRSIEEIIILADNQINYREFEKGNPNDLSREDITKRMLDSGVWTLLRERPFNLTPNPGDVPKSIFISGFNSAPLAPNYNFMMEGKEREFQTGLDALAKLTDGLVHLNLTADKKATKTFTEAKNVQINWFSGPHPAGNVGVQIHQIDPINKGDQVWVMNPQDVVILGRLFLEGRYDARKMMVVAGPVVEKPTYFNTIIGANVKNIIEGNLTMDNVRVISGDVLTGRQIGKEGFVGTFSDMVTVIEEGDFFEFLGWLLPSYARPSMSPTFPWKFLPNEEFEVNTNTHGEERAFVVTGQYETVCPMDIFPQQLLKAIISRDFELIEGLGIYEVAEEDLALCEFVCTSKTPVQKILREGIEFIREQA